MSNFFYYFYFFKVLICPVMVCQSSLIGSLIYHSQSGHHDSLISEEKISFWIQKQIYLHILKVFVHIILVFISCIQQDAFTFM